MIRRILIYLPLVFLCVSAAAQKAAPGCSSCAEWNRPQKPFRIFGNTYYVGPHGLSSILITSSAGNILIDAGLPESAEPIAANIRSLGFRVEDIKIILNSHVHFDHAGGIAALQRMSGARVMASPWSATVLRKGGIGRGDPQYSLLQPLLPVKKVQELRDGETLTLVGISITAHFTPGHTPGGTSWTWQSCEGSVCRNMVFADSLTPISADGFKFSDSRDYPQALDDFEKSFRFLDTTPCDILITTHPEASSLWDRLAARENGVVPDPMVNPLACKDLAKSARERLRQRLAEESGTPAAK
ncbi:MAG: subclass B3 metallo-beta-lactamase [Candidatus Sulfotelmatobacter sp.]